jgi:cell division protein FtsI/penicillin-binding protein 2
VRLNVLMGIVVVMLGALGLQLMNLQITDHEKFAAQVTTDTQSIEKEKVQRGMIYDATGKVLVANKGVQAITYTKPKNVTNNDLFKIANAVGNYLTIDTAQLSKSNYALYYILDEKRAAAIAKHIKNVGAFGTDLRQDQLLKYVNKHAATLTLTDDERNKAMIFQKMANAYSLSTVYIKETDVTDAEIANIGERQAKMPGVKVGLYYSRDYPNGDSMKSVIGSVSTSKSGLPDSQVNTLLTEGYARDDSVGTSYLEQYYETALRGTKARKAVTTEGKTGNTKTETIYAGQAGDSLKLTINAKFQEDVQNILSTQMPGGLTQGAYAVVLNPKTGAVYSLGGVYRDNKTGEKTDDALGNINRSLAVGSAVKPAMITTGFMNGVITPENSNITDVPIQIAATPVKASLFNQNGAVPLNAVTALKMSSNSYVMQIMLKLGGVTYYPNMDLSALNPDVWNKMRNGFARFGLGVKTGIDLPNESAGLRGSTDASHLGNTLDESFGQYDTFTPMQLAQYAATVANGGYRIRPHVVGEILERDAHSDTDKVATTIQPEVLGTVGWTKAEKDTIWEGMNQVVNGTGYITGSGLAGLTPKVYAKTGTAQTFTDGQETYSSTAISFVPNSDVAIAVAVPGVSSESADAVSVPITKAIWEAYWKDVEAKP